MNTLTHDLAASVKALLPSSQRVLDEIEYTPELYDAIITAEMVLDSYDLGVALARVEPFGFVDARVEMACWDPTDEPAMPLPSLWPAVIAATLVLVAVGLYMTQAPQCREAGASTVLLCTD